jgi:trimeric autotransporter adhesin
MHTSRRRARPYFLTRHCDWSTSSSAASTTSTAATPVHSYHASEGRYCSSAERATAFDAASSAYDDDSFSEAPAESSSGADRAASSYAACNAVPESALPVPPPSPPRSDVDVVFSADSLLLLALVFVLSVLAQAASPQLLHDWSHRTDYLQQTVYRPAQQQQGPAAAPAAAAQPQPAAQQTQSPLPTPEQHTAAAEISADTVQQPAGPPLLSVDELRVQWEQLLEQDREHRAAAASRRAAATAEATAKLAELRAELAADAERAAAAAAAQAALDAAATEHSSNSSSGSDQQGGDSSNEVWKHTVGESRWTGAPLPPTTSRAAAVGKKGAQAAAAPAMSTAEFIALLDSVEAKLNACSSGDCACAKRRSNAPAVRAVQAATTTTTTLSRISKQGLVVDPTSVSRLQRTPPARAPATSTTATAAADSSNSEAAKQQQPAVRELTARERYAHVGIDCTVATVHAADLQRRFVGSYTLTWPPGDAPPHWRMPDSSSSSSSSSSDKYVYLYWSAGAAGRGHWVLDEDLSPATGVSGYCESEQFTAQPPASSSSSSDDSRAVWVLDAPALHKWVVAPDLSIQCSDS